jgi:hypothetical protein
VQVSSSTSRIKAGSSSLFSRKPIQSACHLSSTLTNHSALTSLSGGIALLSASLFLHERLRRIHLNLVLDASAPAGLGRTTRFTSKMMQVTVAKDPSTSFAYGSTQTISPCHVGYLILLGTGTLCSVYLVELLRSASHDVNTFAGADFACLYEIGL